MPNKVILAAAIGVVAVGGVGTATAINYHSGWPAGSSATSKQMANASAASPTSVAPTRAAATGEAPTTAAPTTSAPATPASPGADTSAPAAAPVTAAPASAPTTVTPATVAATPTTTVAPQGPITYTVLPGDNLSVIAAWFKQHGYGALYEANKAVIGANPNLIHPGQKITIGGSQMTVSQ